MGKVVVVLTIFALIMLFLLVSGWVEHFRSTFWWMSGFGIGAFFAAVMCEEDAHR